MIKYTITIEEEGKTALAYITVQRPLVGDEPVIQERFKALEDLLDSQHGSSLDVYRTTRFSESRRKVEA